MPATSREFASVDACVDEVIARVGKDIVLGAPPGLGKPNQLINGFFRRAKGDPTLSLTIYTALSLERPRPSSDLEARFLEPFVARHFGDYVELEYMRAIRAGTLPPNVTYRPGAPAHAEGDDPPAPAGDGARGARLPERPLTIAQPTP